MLLSPPPIVPPAPAPVLAVSWRAAAPDAAARQVRFVVRSLDRLPGVDAPGTAVLQRATGKRRGSVSLRLSVPAATVASASGPRLLAIQKRALTRAGTVRVSGSIFALLSSQALAGAQPTAGRAPVGPSPSTPVSSTPVPAPIPADQPLPVPAGALPITQFGAVCDGQTDDAGAIGRAVAAAKTAGVAVLVPAKTCAYGSVLRLDGVQLWGTGDASTLWALDPTKESIFLLGDGAAVRQLTLTGATNPTRLAPWEATRVTAFSATNFTIDRLRIEGSAAAGIQMARGPAHGHITNNRLSHTLSDSIHLTDGASDITVTGNQIDHAGDDGIAVVSYRSNGAYVSDVVATDNVVTDSLWGRQMSVVGGQRVRFSNNRLSNNLGGAACLYIAQEESYKTYGAHDVMADHNTLTSCGGAQTGHGAIMVFSNGAEANTNISLVRNDIVQTGLAGIRVFSDFNQGVVVDSNRIVGASPALNITSPGASLTPYSDGPVGYQAP